MNLLMNKQLKSLIEELFPNISSVQQIDHLLNVYSTHLIKEFEHYSEHQYRKYKNSTNSSVKDNDWVLGTSEGADHCIDILKKILE
jgi:hypothetical protein